MAPTTAMETASSVKPATSMESPSTTTVEASAAVEAASTLEPAATMEALSAAEAATAVPSAFTAESAPMPSALAVKIAAAPVPSPMIIPVAAVESMPSTIVAGPVVTMKPRPRSNEYAAGEIVRPVVAVGRTGIGVIAIVPVRTNRWGADVDRGNAHSDMDGNLRVSSPRHGNEHPNHDHVF
jgi:hypothetical protein